jgi:Carboxypeptidase regulatory-like domain
VTKKGYRNLSLRLWSLLILLLICLPAFAQYSGNVQGVVSDPAGAAINGASVQLRNSDTGVTAAVSTGESGNYRFSSLPPGNYVLTTEVKGFRKAESSVTLSTSEILGIHVPLPLAATRRIVNVEVTLPVVDTDDSRSETTLSSDTVRDLPRSIAISGTSWQLSRGLRERAREPQENPRAALRITSGHDFRGGEHRHPVL